MEFYAVPAVEGLVEGGEGPQQGSLANSVQKFRFSPTCSRAKRPAHMDTHGPELVHIGKQHISRGTMSQAAATCNLGTPCEQGSSFLSSLLQIHVGARK